MGEKGGIITDPRVDWSSEYSIGFLPRNIRDLFRERADLLHSELRANRLEVILVPAPEQKFLGHMVREVVSQNPPWYQELFRTYPTQLRRPHSLRALDRIRCMKDPELSAKPRGAIQQYYKYTTFYREVIFEMLVFGYENGIYIPPEPRVQEFFGVEGIDKVLEHPL